VAVHQLEPALVGEGVEAVEEPAVERLPALAPAAVRLLDPERLELPAVELVGPPPRSLRDDGAVPDGPPLVQRERMKRRAGRVSPEEVLEDVVPAVLRVGLPVEVGDPAQPAGLERPCDRDDLGRLSSPGCVFRARATTQ
jgi:hypothetical protein